MYLLSMSNVFVAHLAARPVARPIVWPGPLRDPSRNALQGLSSGLSSDPSRGPSCTLCAAYAQPVTESSYLLTLDVKCVCRASRRPARRPARCATRGPARYVSLRVQPVLQAASLWGVLKITNYFFKETTFNEQF